jgi:high-affinity iron transporter
VWDNVFPSFLIGLREGLEAGLIVSVLIATLVRSDQRARLPHVWTGVLAAVGLSVSLGAVLTFTAASLSGRALEAFGGTLSLVAVAFVTAMVFWLRRSARSLARRLEEKVGAALALGAGMLVATSFIAVAREGLETALFLWTTAQAAGESAGPVAGAVAGLLIAAGLCWGLYRRVLNLNLTKFFTATGCVLIVIASGVLGYGVRDLQEAGVLPGASSDAFDLSSKIDASSWYATLIQGTLNITPKMTWLQMIAYVGYLAVVMTLFLRGVRAPKTAGTPAHADDLGPVPVLAKARSLPRWVVPLAVVAAPALVAGVTIAVGSGKPSSGTPAIAVSEADCGKGFTAPQPGRQIFQVRNTGDRPAEVYLIDPASNAVYGEVEGIAPGTTRDLVATIGAGSYAWRCVPKGAKAVTSAAVRVAVGEAGRAVLPVSEGDLAVPLAAYRAYVQKGLANLLAKTRTLEQDIDASHLDTAREHWLPAHEQYAELGAAYGTFGDYDAKINGRPVGLPRGVRDPDFTGFHRIEYGLWHGESAAPLARSARQLTGNVAALSKDLPKQEFDVADLPLRSHEILENTLHQELTGANDYGSGTVLATTEANLKGTEKIVDLLRPLIQARNPKVLTAADRWMRRTQQLVLSARGSNGRWKTLDQLPAATRQQLNGALSQLLEELAPIPSLLEIRKAK